MKYAKKFTFHNNSKKGGFTLIELVASMAIMVILVSMVFSIFLLSSKLSTKTNSYTIIQDKYRIAIMNMEDDIRYSTKSYLINDTKYINENSPYGNESEVNRAKAVLYLEKGNNIESTEYILYAEKDKKLFRIEVPKPLKLGNESENIDIEIKGKRQVLDGIESYEIKNTNLDGEDKKINIVFQIKSGKEVKEYSTSVLSKS